MLVDAVALWVEWREQSAELLDSVRALDLKSATRRISDLADSFRDTRSQVSSALANVVTATSLEKMSKLRGGWSASIEDLTFEIRSTNRDLANIKYTLERLAAESRRVRRRLRGLALMAKLRSSALPVGVPMLLCAASLSHYLGHMGLHLLPSAPELLRRITPLRD